MRQLWLILSTIISYSIILYLIIDLMYISECFIIGKDFMDSLINDLNIIVGLMIGVTDDIKRTTTTIILLIIVGINFKLIIPAMYAGFFLKNYKPAF